MNIFYSRLFSFYLCSVFFFPLLPQIMGNSQIHINFITLIGSVFFIFLFRKDISYRTTCCLFLYFFVMQMFLFGSVYNGFHHENLSMSAIFSTVRPVMLFLLYLSISEGCRRYDLVSRKEFKIIIIISFFYVLLEVFFLQYSKDIITVLYKREYRPELFFAGITFFGTTYYSGYVFLCLFFLSFVNLYNSRKTLDKVVFFMAFFLVLISLSKTMIVVLFMSAYIFVLFYVRSYFIRFLMLFFPPLFVLGLFIFQNEISTLLKDAGVPALRSINTLLYDSSNSGTLSTRTDQVIESFNLAQRYSVIFGAGLGQDASIESLPAVFLYRYGIIGLLFFYLCNIFLVIYAFYRLFFENRRYFAINLALLMWSLSLPITHLSGAMIEQSKMALVSALMLGYLFRKNDYVGRMK